MIDQNARNAVALYRPMQPGARIAVTNMPTVQLKFRRRAMGMASLEVALAS
jgi:hypothetical protein